MYILSYLVYWTTSYWIIWFALLFDLSEPNRQTSVSGLTSNDSENWRSDFYCTRIFTVTYFLGNIGLLSVNISGVDTITASRMDLYCCWSSNFPRLFYNLFIFPDIYVHILHCYFRLFNSNSDHMLFQSFGPKQTFNNDTLILKWLNLNN